MFGALFGDDELEKRIQVKQVISMSDDKKDKEIVRNYFSQHGLRCEEIPTKQGIKTPDFELFNNKKRIAICEVKAILFDTWLVDQNVHNQVISRKDPIPNRLSSDIYEASKQLKSYDPDNEVSRILAFVNYDPHCDLTDLRDVITGNFYAEDGSIHSIYKKISEGRIKNPKDEIGLFLWIPAKDPRLLCSWSVDGSNSAERMKVRKFWNPSKSEHPELASVLCDS
jgi:hypothetical protein